MDIKKINIESPEQSQIDIGYEGEHGYMALEFDLNNWAKKYGSGSATLKVKRPGEKGSYPQMLVEIEKNVYRWEISKEFKQIKGYGELQLIYSDGQNVLKSRIFKTYLNQSLESGGVEPQDMQDFMDSVIQTGMQSAESAKASEASAEHSEASAQESAKFADAAEQSANKSGYMFFEVKNGRLILSKTTNTVDFKMMNGRLILNG